MSREPHYHVWRRARSGAIMYQLVAAYATAATAATAAAEIEPDPERRCVLPCRDPSCPTPSQGDEE